MFAGLAHVANRRRPAGTGRRVRTRCPARAKSTTHRRRRGRCKNAVATARPPLPGRRCAPSSAPPSRPARPRGPRRDARGRSRDQLLRPRSLQCRLAHSPSIPGPPGTRDRRASVHPCIRASPELWDIFSDLLVAPRAWNRVNGPPRVPRGAGIGPDAASPDAPIARTRRRLPTRGLVLSSPGRKARRIEDAGQEQGSGR